MVLMGLLIMEKVMSGHEMKVGCGSLIHIKLIEGRACCVVDQRSERRWFGQYMSPRPTETIAH